jgi:heme exporter protein B
MNPWLRVVAAVVRKDVVLELRAKRGLALAVVFAMLVTVTFAFAFAQRLGSNATVGRAALWVSVLFAGVVLVTRTAAIETADGAIDGLLMAPADRTAVFVGKTAANTLFLVVVETTGLGFVFVFLDFAVPPSGLGVLALAFGLAAAGFAAAGTLLSVLTVRSRLPELTLPLVLVPVVVPVLLAGIELTRAAASGAPAAAWLQLLVAYDGILLFAGIALFEPTVET